MKTREIKIGNIKIGGGNPVAIQSMCNVDTCDTEAVAKQILELEQAGCEIIRVAAYDENAAKNIKNIKEYIHIPIVADVHFDHRIAIAAMENGADKVRINPGNIGSHDRIKMVVDCAKEHHIPLRVGANTGSLAKNYHGMQRADALVESAMENIRILEKEGFYDIVVSLKASDVADTVKAYRRMSEIADYPLHLGVTEAGIYSSSIVKSSMGIGALLIDGIGDTVRVSITGGVLEEVSAAKDILRYAGVRSFGPEIISCPTCGRTRIDIPALAAKVTESTRHIDKPVKIAVMGCVVNGPGEARGCDLGIAGGEGEGLLFFEGKPIKKIEDKYLLEELVKAAEEAAKKYQ
ncbi:MAG: flavodoxin-dependent (E)-4-hydroxy-3-methylbut-2-enyl-diphosphate synthase [Christensenellaceae bacterium]|nr:flavodoxin-dependent (E)-4-hydroxy-3-methylbut-2-enyl-diphosphate synthase [Christensenellaceae bacterium]